MPRLGLSRICGGQRITTEDKYTLSLCTLDDELDISLLPTLAMSDELAQDEEDAEDYDLEALERRMPLRDDDEATLVGRRGPGSVAEDHVVFEIGDEDDDEEAAAKKRHAEHRSSVEGNGNAAGEREGLISGTDQAVKDHDE